MSAVDVRGFRWGLVPLERKAEMMLEGARLRLGALRRQDALLRKSIARLETRREATLENTRRGRTGNWDPAAHSRALLYLLHEELLVDAKRKELREVASRIESEQQACAVAERRLSAMQKLHSKARDAYAVRQARAMAKEADLAWLADRTCEAPGGGL